MLAVVSLIVALAGVAIGAFSFISMNNYINDLNTYINETNAYVLPMARMYYEGPTYTIPDGGGPMLFNYTHKSYDTHEAFNLDTDSYIIPETGYYQVTAQYSIDAVDGGFFLITLNSNNVEVSQRASTCSRNTNVFGVAIVDILMFDQGDSITVKIYQSDPGAVSRNIFDGEEETFFAIAKIA